MGRRINEALGRFIALMTIIADTSPEEGIQTDPTPIRPADPETPEEIRERETETRRRRGERSSVDERESRRQYPPPEPPPEPPRRRSNTPRRYSRPVESRPPVTRPTRPSVTRGGGIGQRHGVGGRTSGFASLGSLLNILDIALVASSFMLARSPRERVRIAGEFIFMTAAGRLLARFLGVSAGPVTLGLSMVTIPTDPMTPVTEAQRLEEREFNQRIEEFRFRELWDQHVNTIIPQLAEHLDQFDLVLDEVERFIENLRTSLRMSRNHLDQVQVGRLENESRELMVLIRTSSAMIFRDLQQLTIQDLPNVRRQLLDRGISEALLSEIGM